MKKARLMSENLAEDLKLCNYDYILLPNLIASSPIIPKEEAKLLVYERAKNKITHTKFGALCEFLPECDLIFNDTKVLKARLFAKKESGAEVEIFFHKMLNDSTFLAQIKGKVKQGQILSLNENIKAQILKLNDDGTRELCFLKDEKRLNEDEIYALLEQHGHIPLPPYIKRAGTQSDNKDYQSLFARNLGAVAAPTASLHFSQTMIEKLSKSHKIHTLTLHIGAGTFKGVESEDIRAHKMHSESFFISNELARLIKSDKALLCVGTTTARVVEHFARTSATKGECELFLHPQNKPLRVNYLLTNFHLPKSTLIMLVSAFIGRAKCIEIYKEAISKNYRFCSYGDCMLII